MTAPASSWIIAVKAPCGIAQTPCTTTGSDAHTEALGSRLNVRQERTAQMGPSRAPGRLDAGHRRQEFPEEAFCESSSYPRHARSENLGPPVRPRVRVRSHLNPRSHRGSPCCTCHTPAPLLPVPLLEHLVCQYEDRRGNHQAKGLGGPGGSRWDVVPRRLLHREVTRTRPL